jgi:hypothetical protein
VVAEPLDVGHAVRAAGDHAEVVLGQPHDREVGLEAAGSTEDRGVDHATDRDVHLAHATLHRRERAGADDVEDANAERSKMPAARASRGARR